jgi:hypothetical protein
MSSALFAPVCSITTTRRRRFLWAAWWTGAPTQRPFRKPDAFQGGARTRAEAKLAAERVAGCSLLELEGSWARAWSNVLAGQEPWPSKRSQEQGDAARAAKAPAPVSIWQTLGLTPQASIAEIKRAYRLQALHAHPDRGGSSEAFRALQSAYEGALKRRARRPEKPKTR